MQIRCDDVPTVCCCVLLGPEHLGHLPEVSCAGLTTGPDDPFCEDCTSRHDTDPRVQTGVLKVTARLHQPVQ